MKKRRKHLADVCVIASLLLISIIGVSILLLTRQSGNKLVVELNGEKIAEYSLSEDGEYILGNGSNTLVIEDGQAYMTYADCPDKTCVKTGRISYVGQSITCLPNRITVRIVGDGDTDIVS